MSTKWIAATGVLLACCALAPFVSAQVSVEEAQKRLQAKLSTRPAATQPVSELERLRDENTRLRVRVSELQMQVDTLRDALGQNPARPAGSSRSGAATQPSNTSGPEQRIIGAWRGGDPAHGAGYILEFGADGAYHRTFLQYPQKESGHFKFDSNDTMALWIGDDESQGHTEYRIELRGNQLTLTPLSKDGLEVRRPVPIVLMRGQ